MNTHAMRRKDRRMPEEESLALLRQGEYGVMSTTGPDGKPYGIPLSYVWLKERVYFHCARDGRKIDNVRANSAVTFTVVGQTRPVYAKNFTTYYESVILSGNIAEVIDPEEKYAALFALAVKYLPEHRDKADRDIRRSFDRTAVYAIYPDEISGKAKRIETAPS